jgi:hypothetical protein
MPKRAQAKRGRPSAWNAETALVVGAAIGAGLSLEQAAKFAGVAVSTLYAWENAGKFSDSRFTRIVQVIADLTSAQEPADSSNSTDSGGQFLEHFASIPPTKQASSPHSDIDDCSAYFLEKLSS